MYEVGFWTCHFIEKYEREMRENRKHGRFF